MFNAIRSGLGKFFQSRSIQTKVDPNAPFALYFDPSGRVTPITVRSMSGWSNGEYNALNASTNRSRNATASNIGFAYLSEVNVWVRRCIEIRAQNQARLDWYVEDKRTGRRIENHPLTVAIGRAKHFMLRYERSMDIWGEVYIKPLRNQYGFYSDLWWLNNLSVSFAIVNGAIYEYFFVPLHGGKSENWMPDEVAYIYNENAFDDLHGSSRILSVLHEANVHEEIARSAQAHFANDARPGIMFLPETSLGVPQSEEFIEYWKKNFQGSLNTNKPVILPMQIKSVQTLERASLKDDVELRGSIRREICAAFGVPLSVAGAWDDANYQSAPEQRISLYEDTVIPEAEQIGKDMDRNLLPFFDDSGRTRVMFDAKKLLALAEDKQAKAAALNSQLVSGGITLNDYRQALDQEAIPAGNVFYIPSSVIVTPADKLGTMPPPAPPGGGFGFHSAPTVSVDTPSVPALPSGEEPSKDAPGVAMLLSLKNNVDLIGLQKRLKTLLPDPSIQWTDPNEFHVTLVYVPITDDAQVEQLVSYILDYTTPDLQLSVGSLASFDSAPGQRAIHLRIRADAGLREYQDDLCIAATNAGMKLSGYSENWKPHITMAYAPERIRVATYNGNLNVRPDELQISVERNGQYEVVHRAACGQVSEVVQSEPEKPKGLPGSTETIAVIEPPPTAKFGSAFDGINQNGDEPELPISHISIPVDPFLDELNAYEKFTLNRWGQPVRAFKFNIITEPLSSELTGQIAACSSKAQVKKLFEGLRGALKADDDPDVVTPEQAQEWWGDYDRLLKRLGNDWLRDYMREVWRKLEGRLNRDITADTVGELLQDFHPELIQKWTGTAEEPGVIAKLFMAGMGAGQASLERKRTNMNPAKASELVIDWELVPADAIAAVEKYVGKLIRGIDRTTLADVQRIITAWLESGQPVSELAKQLNPIFNDPARADLIAQTESSNAYNSGAVQRWEDAGVTQMKFKTVRDSRVCPQCDDLAGQIGTLENGWNGTFIPVHPGCRCYASPVL